MAENIIIDEEKEKRKRIRDEIIEKINEARKPISAEERVAAPESLNLTPINHVPKTDEELLSEAEQTVAKEYAAAIDGLNKKDGEKRSALEKQKEALGASLEEALAGIDSDYGYAVDSVEKQALSRGLARSSVVMKQLEDIEKDRLAKRSEKAEVYSESIAKLEGDITALTAERADAIEALDLGRIEKLNGELKRLTKERDDKIIEAVKYNNTLTEKEGEYQLSKKRAEALYGNAAEKPSESTINKIVRSARTVLDTLAPSEAVNLLMTDKDIQEALGAYYVYLVNYYRKQI